MKTVTSIRSNFISVAILPTHAVPDPIAFIIRTTAHAEIVCVLEKLIAMRNSEQGYFTEITIDVDDPFYGNIKFHKYDHSYVAIVTNHCSTRYFGELNLLKPVVKQIKKWIERNATTNQ